MTARPPHLSQTLSALRRRQDGAAEDLMEAVYEPLRALAQSYFQGHGAGHTLQPTALVHEAWVRLVDRPEEAWKDRAHFLAVCAKVMRGILVDHARAKASAKRGGIARRVPLDANLGSEIGSGIGRELDVLELEERLAQLAELDERQARVAECRLFGGMTVREVADVLDVSPRTVDDDWAMARAWLGARLSPDP